MTSQEQPNAKVYCVQCGHRVYRPVDGKKLTDQFGQFNQELKHYFCESALSKLGQQNASFSEYVDVKDDAKA